MSIVVENLSYTYRPGTPWAVPALDRVNLTVAYGERLALVGGTGSGKSTLIQHLNGLLRPVAGRVLVDGADIWAKGYDRRALRRKVALAFQFPEQQVFEPTVRDDVAYGPRMLGLPEKEVAERVATALAAVDLAPDLLDRSPFELSGGQLRRVALAGILALEPKVLILDEPTAGLDPRGRRRLLGAVARWQEERDLTIIFVSHNMDEVAQIARRVVVMDQGRVVLDGAPRELFARGEELQRFGLGVPVMAQLMTALRRQGWDVPPAAMDTAEAEDIIVGKVAAAGPC